METEKERLNGPHPSRGVVVIQHQRNKSDSNSGLSISIPISRNNYNSDDSKSEESSTQKSKHHRSSKQILNMLKNNNKSEYHMPDADGIGGGSSIHQIEINNIIHKLGGDNPTTDAETLSDSSDMSNNNNNNKDNYNRKRMRDFRIDYSIFQWIFIILFTLWAVIDRFTVNLFPLWVDSPGPTIANNFSVSLFALIAWISGRMMLVSSSYLFLFQNHVFWNWFIEIKWINKYIRIGDIHYENSKLHYHIGWLFCGIPVLLHVWSIIFAGLSPQNSMKLYDSWMRPNDSNGKSIPFYANNLLSLGINDVYRLVSTSVAFLILIPYSVLSCFRNRNWSFAQWIHLFGALLYTVDLIRMYSHPHCWIFNCPFILWWIIDRLYGIFYYRRCVAVIVKKLDLDCNYMILYLRIPDILYNKRQIGDVFYFNELKCIWDRAHPFTVFYNHKYLNQMILNEKEELLKVDWSGHKFQIHHDYKDEYSQSQSQYLMSRKSTVSCSDDISLENDNIIPIQNDWNCGIIVQIISDHKNCYYRKTWTNNIFKSDIRFLCGLRAFGPYRSEYRLLIKDNNNYPFTPLVLIGTGAGCAMLIDFYNYIINENIILNKCVTFYFSTRSIAMFQWFTDITCHRNINNLFVNAHLTSYNNISKSLKNNLKPKSRNSNIGRLDIHDIINGNTDHNTNVYFCGAPIVQKLVGGLCEKFSLTFHAGHAF